MKMLEIVISVVIALVIFGPLAASFIFYSSAKQSALNAFLERYENAKILKSGHSAWLLEVDGKPVELKIRLDLDSMDAPVKPTFQEAETVYIAYYKTGEYNLIINSKGLHIKHEKQPVKPERRAIIIPLETLETDEIPGVPQLEKESFESFKLGELNWKDKIFLQSEILIGWTLPIVLLLAFIILSYSGLKKLVKSPRSKR